MSKMRTWTDRSGSFKVEAEFIGLKDNKIHLHKLNGVKIAVPVVKMAMEDLEYVERVTGVSLDDDKPLADIRRRSTQSAKDGKRPQAAQAPKSGATIQQVKPPKPEGPEYDWFDFFLKAGVSPYQCERYAFNFTKDSMDENVLADITPAVLRTLGLKEGDILRVMKYLDTKFGRTGMLSSVMVNKPGGGNADVNEGVSSPDSASGGLFSGPGGALMNNTRKGRPAPAVQNNDVVDSAMLKQKEGGEAKAKDRTETPLAQAPAPPRKDTRGFDDDAWDVKPSKQPAQQPAPKPVEAPPPAASAAPPQQPTLTGSLLDLSLLSPPLQPTPAQKPSVRQPQQMQNQQPPQAPAQQPMQQQPQQQPMQQQPTGANPSFFSQLGPQPTGTQFEQQIPQQSFGIQQQNQQTYQNQMQPQQTAPPRQRPQAPQQTQSGALMPPPPVRPLSAPQTQPQNSKFGPPPLQPQLTGYQPQSHLQQQIAPPGQSLNDLNQQRLQQQQYGQQQQFGQPQFSQQQMQPQQTGLGQQLQPQPTGFGQQQPGFNQFSNGIPPQQTGFGQQFIPSQQPGLQNIQNPYINGAQAGSPFADPRGQQQTPGFLQPQITGYQPQFQPSLQSQQTGLNSILPPALQPQQTGVNGFSRPGFGQTPASMPPMPPMPQQQPAAAPLQPQKTGPAPPVRFGTAPNKLVPQKTGRANLSAASKYSRFQLVFSHANLCHSSFESLWLLDIRRITS